MTAEIWNENLDLGRWGQTLDFIDAGGEMSGALIGQIIAGYAGDDNVVEAKLKGGFGQALRLGNIGRLGLGIGLGYGAEGAAPGTGIAEDHESGGLVGVAIADVGALGLFTDGYQAVLAQ